MIETTFVSFERESKIQGNDVRITNLDESVKDTRGQNKHT